MINGVINVIKPPGMTSSDIVVFLRRLIRIKKIGHTGTLDPDAAGVLPICIGKATKIADYLMNSEKVYRCEMVLGIETDTCDISGEIIAKSEVFPPKVSKEEVIDTILSFTGEILQKPPMFSAIKIKGKKLYEMARQGKSLDVPPRKVNIHDISILDSEGDNTFFFEVKCSKGTYIRALCRDIGRKLGCGATMSFLVRNKSGAFDIQDGYTLDEINCAVETDLFYDLVVPTDIVLSGYMPGITLKNDVLQYLLNGNMTDLVQITDTTEKIEHGQLCRIYCSGRFIGIGYCDLQIGKLKMKNVLSEEI